MTDTTACPAPWIDWVQAAQRGDEQAFCRLVDASRNLVCAITFAIVRDVQRSEDVAQEVLLAVWRGLPRLRDPSSFLPWLRQLARNRAHDALRQATRHRRLQATALAALTDRADPGAVPEAILRQREDEAVLCEGLAALPDEAREVLTLYYREGRSIEQVAALLGLGTAAVKKRMQRARDQLRADLLERMGEIAQRTAPGAAFSVAIAGAVGLGAPASAAAAGFGTAAKATGAIKLLIASLAMLPGLVAGLAGILLPLRGLARRALDHRERRELRTLGISSSLSLLVFMAGVQMALATGKAAFLIGGYAVMQAAFIALYGFWLPRIQQRRQAVERAADPTSVRRHRRERFWGLFGLVVGSTCGALTVHQVITRLFHAP